MGGGKCLWYEVDCLVVVGSAELVHQPLYTRTAVVGLRAIAVDQGQRTAQFFGHNESAANPLPLEGDPGYQVLPLVDNVPARAKNQVPLVGLPAFQTECRLPSVEPEGRGEWRSEIHDVEHLGRTRKLFYYRTQREIMYA